MQGKSELPQDKVEAIHRGYRVLENYLTKTLFLASDNMTVADLSVFAWMESITQVVFASEKDYPRITSWLAVLRKLPYYEEANKTGADLHIKLFNEALKRNKSLWVESDTRCKTQCGQRERTFRRNQFTQPLNRIATIFVS